MSRPRSLVGGLVAAAAALLWATPAHATWSVVAADPDTGEVGVAIASCVPGEALGPLDEPLSPVVLVPGRGAAVTQALLNPMAGAELERVIAFGATAGDAIEAVANAEFDADFQERQHGVVLLGGDAAAFTGNATLAVAAHATDSHVSVQGNILASDEVTPASIAAFRDANGSLADRLVAALAAGSEAGGDVRCPGQTALFAHLAVATTSDDPQKPSVLLTTTASQGADDNPVTRLAGAHARGESLQQVEPDDDDEDDDPARYRIAAGVGVTILVAGVLLRRRRAQDRAERDGQEPS